MPDVFVFVGVLNQSQVSASPFIDIANRVHSCTIGLVDTDVNPTGITYRIPGNDDSADSVHLFLDLVHDVVTQGYKFREDFIKAIEEANKKQKEEAEKLKSEK
jgi:small subunit ribosomal protein S2